MFVVIKSMLVQAETSVHPYYTFLKALMFQYNLFPFLKNKFVSIFLFMFVFYLVIKTIHQKIICKVCIMQILVELMIVHVLW